MPLPYKQIKKSFLRLGVFHLDVVSCCGCIPSLQDVRYTILRATTTVSDAKPTDLEQDW